MKTLWFDNAWQHHFCVYCLTDPTGKKYFGISRYSALRRWKNGKGYQGNRRLDAAVRKYSFANFHKEVVKAELSREEAEQLEAELIEKYNTTDPEKGYNVRKGTVSEEYDVYVLTFPDGKHYVGMTGRPVRARWGNGHEFRKNVRLYRAIKDTGFANIRKEHFAYPLSRGSAERIETALIDWFDSANPEKGYNRGHGALSEHGWRHPEETREKIRDAQRGIPKSEETKQRMRRSHPQKPVRNQTTGQEFPGVREAAQQCGVSPSSITRACSGKQKTAAGCEWEFVKQE